MRASNNKVTPGRDHGTTSGYSVSFGNSLAKPVDQAASVSEHASSGDPADTSTTGTAPSGSTRDWKSGTSSTGSKEDEVSALKELLITKQINQEQFTEALVQLARQTAASETASSEAPTSSQARTSTSAAAARTARGAQLLRLLGQRLLQRTGEAERRTIRKMQQEAGSDDALECMRFLNVFGDAATAIKKLRAHRAWTERIMEPLMLDPQPVISLLSKNTFCAFPCVARDGSRVAIWTPKQPIGYDEDLEEMNGKQQSHLVLALMFALEKAIRATEDPTVRFTVILDRSKLPTRTLKGRVAGRVSIRVMESIMRAMADHMPGRVSTLLVFPAGRAVAAIAGVIQSLRATKAKGGMARVHLLSNQRQLLDYIDADNLWDELGGSVPFKPGLADILFPRPVHMAHSADATLAAEERFKQYNLSALTDGNFENWLWKQSRSEHTGAFVAWLIFFCVANPFCRSIDSSGVRPEFFYSTLVWCTAAFAGFVPSRKLHHVLFSAGVPPAIAIIWAASSSTVNNDAELLVFALSIVALSTVFGVRGRAGAAICTILWILWIVCSGASNGLMWQHAAGIIFVLLVPLVSFPILSMQRRSFDKQQQLTRHVRSVQAESRALRMQSASVPAFSTNRELQITAWSRRLVELTGYSAVEVLGRNVVATLVAPNARHTALSNLNNVIQEGKSQSLELHVTAKNHRILILALSLTPQYDASVHFGDAKGGERASLHSRSSRYRASTSADDAADGSLLNIVGLNAVGQDVTDIREIDSARRTFLASFSHELRTPLNGVMGMLELLSDMDLPAHALNCVNKARTSSDLLMNLIQDILDISRLEAGQLSVEREPFDMHQAIRATVGLMKLQANAKGVQLQKRISPTLPRIVLGDVSRFRQVLLNLVSNAVKFTIEGHVAITASVVEHRDPATPASRRRTVEQSQREGRGTEGEGINGEEPAVDDDWSGPTALLRVCVEDTGIGLREAEAERLFSAFTKNVSKDHHAMNVHGVGLGLSICKRLTQLMGGTVSVRSVFGQGSRFTFTFEVGLLSDADAEREAQRLHEGTHFFEDGSQSTGSRESPRSPSPGQTSPGQMLPQPAEAWSVSRALHDAHAENSLLNALSPNGMHNSSPQAGRSRLGLEKDHAEQRELEKHFAVSNNSFRDDYSRNHAVSNGRDNDRGRSSSERAVSGKQRRVRHESMRAIEVLLVEDNAFNSEVLLAFLASADMRAKWECNGAAAVRTFKQCDFDVVLMDCQMPVMDGYEAVRQIRDWEQAEGVARTPVIALTAYAMEGDKERCLNAGMDAVITKPVSRAALLNAIASQLPESRAALAKARKPQKKEADATNHGNDVVDRSLEAGAKRLGSSLRRSTASLGSPSSSLRTLSSSASSLTPHTQTRNLLGGANKVDASAIAASSRSGAHAHHLDRQSWAAPRSTEKSSNNRPLDDPNSRSASSNDTPGDIDKNSIAGQQATSSVSSARESTRAESEWWELSQQSQNAPIDEALGMTQFGSSKQMYYRMLSKFAAQFLPHGLAACRRAFESRDVVMLRMEAHSLRGSSGFVGATVLYDLCGRLMDICGLIEANELGGSGTRGSTTAGDKSASWQKQVIKQLVTQLESEYAILNSYFRSRKHFAVELENDSTISPSVTSPNEGTVRVCSGATVLLAEDDALSAEIIGLFLRNIGMNVTIATDGVRAVRAFHKNVAQVLDAGSGEGEASAQSRGDSQIEPRISVIVMDCRMPRQDGFDAALCIRQYEQQHFLPATPIVGLTSSSSSEVREQCVSAGMDAFAVKPITQPDLSRLIAAMVLRSPHSPRESDSVGAAVEADVASSCARVNVEILPAVDWEAGVAKHGNASSFTAALCHFALGTPTNGNVEGAEAPDEAPLAQALCALRDSADALATSSMPLRASPGSGAEMHAEALEEVSALMEESRLLRDSAHLLCAARMHKQITKLEKLCQHLQANMMTAKAVGRSDESSGSSGDGRFCTASLLTRCRQLVREIAYEANRMRESARAARSGLDIQAETNPGAPIESCKMVEGIEQGQPMHESSSKAKSSPSSALVPAPEPEAELKLGAEARPTPEPETKHDATSVHGSETAAMALTDAVTPQQPPLWGVSESANTSALQASDAENVSVSAAAFADHVAALGTSFVQYHEMLVSNGVDGSILHDIDDDDLAACGVENKLHRKRICKLAKQISGS